MGYERRLLTLAQALNEAGDLQPGSVVLLTVEHDVDCLMLRGGGRCDCCPDTVRAGRPMSARDRPAKDA